jgi:glycosyltransferase involved in cell wall biosynthesis
MKILIAAHTPVGGPFVIGSHHLARELGRLGHDVLHISQPVTPLHLARILDPSVIHKFRTYTNLPIKREKSDFMDWTPMSLCPGNLAMRLNRRDNLMLSTVVGGLSRVLTQLHYREVDLLVIDTPAFWGIWNYVDARKTIYRPTDIYAHMLPAIPIDRYESILLRKANGLVLTSRPIYEWLAHRHSVLPAHCVLENGVDVDQFMAPADMPPEYAALENPIAVYVGAFDDRFDRDLIVKLAEQVPNLNVVLIGPVNSNVRVKSMPSNVKVLGLRPHSSLPQYLQNANAGLLPLSNHPSNAGRSPMKIYEYLAAGLPVISIYTPELARRNLPGVFLATDAEEFTEYVLVAVATEKGNFSVKLQNCAKEHSWKGIVQELLSFVEDLR